MIGFGDFWIFNNGQSTSDITEDSLEIMNNDKYLISFIPIRLTRFIQPLDVQINKTFKDTLKIYQYE